MRHFRILVLDGDPVIRRFVRERLEDRGYRSLAAHDLTEAFQILEQEPVELVIVDLPEGDSVTLCGRLRELSEAPVIVLSARTDEDFKIKCFNAGADDYLTRPFSIEELLARVRAVLRRRESFETAPQLAFAAGDLKIRFAERQVLVGDREVKLTPTEYCLLQELALNADKVLTHDLLLNRVWGPEYRQEREYLRVFVGRLRRKLEADPRRPNVIVTVPWVGYKLKATCEPKRCMATA